MEQKEVIILGCGASGSICALKAKTNNILVIDDGNKIAKKLLVTGNGRCNLTNLNMKSEFFNQNVDDFLQKFSEKDTISFFSSLGLMTYADEEGRVYPLSNSAKSVVKVIQNAFEKQKIDVLLNEKVVDVESQNDMFIVKTEHKTFACKKLVCALGGKNAQKIAEKFNIPYSLCHPSLVGLKTKVSRFLNGVKVHALVTAKASNKIKMAEGEVLFRENGLSGICVFNVSTLFAREKCFSGEISLDLMPKMDEKNERVSFSLNFCKKSSTF